MENFGDYSTVGLVEPMGKFEGDELKSVQFYCPTEEFSDYLPPQAHEHGDDEQTNVYVTYEIKGSKPSNVSVSWVKTHDTDERKCCKGELKLPAEIKEALLAHPAVEEAVADMTKTSTEYWVTKEKMLMHEVEGTYVIGANEPEPTTETFNDLVDAKKAFEQARTAWKDGLWKITETTSDLDSIEYEKVTLAEIELDSDEDVIGDKKLATADSLPAYVRRAADRTQAAYWEYRNYDADTFTCLADEIEFERTSPRRYVDLMTDSYTGHAWEVFEEIAYEDGETRCSSSGEFADDLDAWFIDEAAAKELANRLATEEWANTVLSNEDVNTASIVIRATEMADGADLGFDEEEYISFGRDDTEKGERG